MHIFHGGGFAFGSKTMGDPLAASEATYLLDDICAEGFNIVSVDYANVPDCHFPIPLIKTNRAIQFLIDHQEEYHLNMDKIFIMGSSAGAIITSQLGSIISNKEHSDLLGIEACITTEQIYGLVIDDASLDYSHFTLATKNARGKLCER